MAGKTGTSENFFDAWFIGYTPQLVTGTWMGYSQGGKTLEYALDYARKLHGISGGITPAQIWKSYMQSIMRGEPIEQFDGTKIPDQKTHTTAPEHGEEDAPGTVHKRAPFATRPLQQDPRTRRAAAPASTSPSSAGPARSRRARAARFSASAVLR